jgi:hypothetical protein
MAHTFNPSYSRGTDQEDLSSKPAQANSLWWDLTSKKPNTKRVSGLAKGVGPSNPSTKKKREEEGKQVLSGMGTSGKGRVKAEGDESEHGWK